MKRLIKYKTVEKYKLDTWAFILFMILMGIIAYA